MIGSKTVNGNKGGLTAGASIDKRAVLPRTFAIQRDLSKYGPGTANPIRFNLPELVRLWFSRSMSYNSGQGSTDLIFDWMFANNAPTGYPGIQNSLSPTPASLFYPIAWDYQFFWQGEHGLDNLVFEISVFGCVADGMGGFYPEINFSDTIITTDDPPKIGVYSTNSTHEGVDPSVIKGSLNVMGESCNIYGTAEDSPNYGTVTCAITEMRIGT